MIKDLKLGLRPMTVRVAPSIVTEHVQLQTEMRAFGTLMLCASLFVVTVVGGGLSAILSVIL
ncbi:MAG: hypothetical protein R3E60_07775 [Alphaproteobacteria bacterium]